MNSTDVSDYLTEQAARLAVAVGESYCSVTCSVLNACHNCAPNVEWKTYVAGDNHRSAPTCEEAIAASIAAMSPDRRAKELREKAAALLAEADKLEVPV